MPQERWRFDRSQTRRVIGLLFGLSSEILSKFFLQFKQLLRAIVEPPDRTPEINSPTLQALRHQGKSPNTRTLADGDTRQDNATGADKHMPFQDHRGFRDTSVLSRH